MMKKIIPLIVVLTYFSVSMNAQGISINSLSNPPDSSAMLDVNSTSKGELMPRMSTAQRNAIVKPATGLFVFNTDCNVVNYNAGTPSNPNWATMNASNVLVAGVTIAANSVGTICAGSSVTFTATPTQNNLSPSYQWQVNGSNKGSNSPTFTDSSLNNGDVVTCILTSSVPCVTGSPATSNPITMLVNSLPVINGTTPASFCSGGSFTLGASPSLGSVNWYADSTGGSSLYTGSYYTVSGLTSTTTYYVDATANGCTSSSRTAVTATSYPTSPAQPGAISGPTVLNQNDTETYSISPVTYATNYTWTASLGTIISGQGTDSIGIIWGDSSGTGSVSVVAINVCGTSAAQTLAVGVQQVILSANGNGNTGSIQTFNVPINATYTIQAYGAQGGNGGNNIGGYGALMQGDFSLTQGQQLSILVGQIGCTNLSGSGGGGGGTFVVLNGNPLIVAGGGGGAGNSNAGGPGLTTTSAGNSTGGDPAYGGTANSGGSSSSYYYGGAGGGGGTCCDGAGINSGGGLGSDGGAGFTGNGGAGQDEAVNAFSYVNGGYGGYNPNYNSAATTYGGYGGGGNGVSYVYQDGGGGGGGYSGGGGGAGINVGGGGGGGGSYNTGANQNNQQGVQAGNGQVIITW